MLVGASNQEGLLHDWNLREPSSEALVTALIFSFSIPSQTIVTGVTAHSADSHSSHTIIHWSSQQSHTVLSSYTHTASIYARRGHLPDQVLNQILNLVHHWNILIQSCVGGLDFFNVDINIRHLLCMGCFSDEHGWCQNWRYLEFEAGIWDGGVVSRDRQNFTFSFSLLSGCGEFWRMTVASPAAEAKTCGEVGTEWGREIRTEIHYDTRDRVLRQIRKEAVTEMKDTPQHNHILSWHTRSSWVMDRAVSDPSRISQCHIRAFFLMKTPNYYFLTFQSTSRHFQFNIVKIRECPLTALVMVPGGWCAAAET